MLKDNIRTLRKEKGLSQEELAVKLNVVRQTVSKWEQGLSVPDAEMLIKIAEVFDTPVNVLLGENISEGKEDDLKKISEKLEVVNLQLAQRRESERRIWHYLFIGSSVIVIAIFVAIAAMGNTYMEWNYSDPELAVMGVGIHAFIWVFVRIAPFILIGLITGIILTRKK
ncbi:MAG: helix-turn-helix transcriptional regulator [Erysipelotrichaceae bacterium]|nr:helix-turn-helix transcriptional regulator [Erysipelotrichaceae bacterium]